MSKESKAPGIIIYLEDFKNLVDQFSDEEIGSILTSLVRHYAALESPETRPATEEEFADRSMRVVYNQLKKRIDTDRERYEKKCSLNSINAAKRWDVRV